MGEVRSLSVKSDLGHMGFATLGVLDYIFLFFGEMVCFAPLFHFPEMLS